MLPLLCPFFHNEHSGQCQSQAESKQKSNENKLFQNLPLHSRFLQATRQDEC